MRILGALLVVLVAGCSHEKDVSAPPPPAAAPRINDGTPLFVSSADGEGSQR